MNLPTRKLFTAKDMIEAYERGFKASSKAWNGDHLTGPYDGIKLRKDAEFEIGKILKALAAK